MKLRHSRRTANSSPSARSGAPASRRIAGTSTSTIAPLPRNGRSSRRRISRCSSSLTHPTALRSGSPRRRRAPTTCMSFLSRTEPSDRRERGRDQRAARRARDRRVLEIEHDVAGGRLRAGRRRQRLHAADHARERDAREGGRLADAGICDGGSAGGTPVQHGCSPPGFDPSRKHPAVFSSTAVRRAWDDAWSSRWNPALWAAQAG